MGCLKDAKAEKKINFCLFRSSSENAHGRWKSLLFICECKLTRMLCSLTWLIELSISGLDIHA